MGVNNSLANRTKKGGFSLYLNSDAVKNQINSVVGGKNGPRFISSIISAVNVNPALQECNGMMLAQGTPEEIQSNPEVIKAYLGD